MALHPCACISHLYESVMFIIAPSHYDIAPMASRTALVHKVECPHVSRKEKLHHAPCHCNHGLHTTHIVEPLYEHKHTVYVPWPCPRLCLSALLVRPKPCLGAHLESPTPPLNPPLPWCLCSTIMPWHCAHGFMN